MVIERAAGDFWDDGGERSRRQRELSGLLSRLEADPNPILFLRAAELLRIDGDATEAARVCEDGIRQYPSYANLYVVQGELAADSRHPEIARKLFEKAASLDEFNFHALTCLANVCMKLRDYAAAAAVGRRILGWLPDDGTGQQILRRAEEAGGSDGGGQE